MFQGTCVDDCEATIEKLIYNGVCVKSCKKGYVKKGKVCTPCHSNCKECSGAG